MSKNILKITGIELELARIATRKLVLNASAATARDKRAEAGFRLELDELVKREKELRKERASLIDFSESDRELTQMIEGRK